MRNCTMALVPKESIELANKFFDSLQKKKRKRKRKLDNQKQKRGYAK